MKENIDTIYLVHHTHTDIGFTNEQPVVMDLHAQFIDQAIDLCEQTADYPKGSALKWTCEAMGTVLYWLRHRSDRQIQRFVDLEKQDRIEVTGTFGVFSQCIPHEAMYRQFYPAEKLRKDYGIKVTTAMHCDINGHNWGMVEAMLDCGIDAFSMAINENVGRAAFNRQRPNGFYWEGASGRKILSWNGLHYNSNNYFGFPGIWERSYRGLPSDKQEAVKLLPAFLDWLKKRQYPYPFSLFQVTYTTFVDNGPPDPRLADFVRWWNENGHAPRMEIVTLREYFDALRRQPAGLLPTHRGEWTDYWNIGAASTAYETSLNRRTYHRLYESELALAWGDPIHALARRPELRESWENAWWYDEHTWGANTSIVQPFRQPARSQLNQKLNFAYRARSFAQLTRLEAIDRVARSLRGEGDGYYVMALNPLPWEREERLQFPSTWLDTDAAATVSHVQCLDRIEGSEQQGLGDQAMAVSEPVRIPPMGYRLFPAARLNAQTVPPSQGRPVRVAKAENSWLRVELDAKRGGIKSLFDKKRRREWVDAKHEYSLGGYVHEHCEAGKNATDMYGGRMQIFLEADWSKFMGYRGWNANWPAVRRGVTKVVSQTATTLPGQIRFVQKCLAPGAKNVEYEITLAEDKAYVDLKVTIDKLWDTAPEACYVTFPFALPKSRPRYQTAGGVVRPHLDQLPDCNQDYHTAQHWADLSNDKCGVTVTTVDAPNVMFGGFNLAKLFDKPRPNIPPLLLSVAMTNYYHVNYAGGQLGSTTFHYRIFPHDAFDGAESNRIGQEAAFPLICHPVMNPAGTRPGKSSLLTLSNPAIVPLAVKPSEDGRALIIRLYNPLDKSRSLTARLFSEPREIWQCDNLENAKTQLPHKGGKFTATFSPHATLAFRVVL
ncbi:MAG: glycoside hydrolase family 38 C-terminal domain-containing protein [Terrimicrobiaceae bacterium]|nr:glycoside hydrolase family 38 C-terminal domain-containing protein [Terrimicrobiaceae bacterium]